MITSGSKRPPEQSAAEPLGALLRGLRSRGLVVGPDDSARVAAVFRYSAGWPHARKVRALKALLARSEEESRILDDLAHLLFVAADHGREAAAGVQAGPPREPLPSEKGSLSAPAGEAEAEPSADRSPERRRFLQYRRLLFVLLGLSLLILAVLLISAYRSRSRQDTVLADEKKIEAIDFRALGRSPETAGAPAPQTPITMPQKKLEPPGRPSQPAVPNFAPSVAPPPEAPKGLPGPRRVVERQRAFLHRRFQPLVLFLALAGSTALIFVRRLIRVERARLNVVALANSLGPRTYRMELGTPLHPLDRDMVRDLVVRLSNASVETFATLVDEDRTVREAARRAGRLDFFYQKQREYRPVLFVEDVSLSMARWPDVGTQILKGLLSQGCEVVHRFMGGSPGRLAKDPELRQGVPLHEMLAGLADPIIIILSDLQDLDARSGREQANWLGPLRQAVWLHPCGVELWGVGARWLSERMTVLSVCNPSSLRLSGMSREERGFIRPWRAPRVVADSSAEAALRSLREAVGEAAFRWLSAGAVLDRIGALTVRNWWAVREEILPVPIDRLQRVLSLPMVVVRADGSATLAEDLRDALIHHMGQEAPDFLSRVVLWGERILEEDLAKLPASSLAAVLVRALQARLLLIDPQNRRQGFRRMKRLESEGYGGWLDREQRIFSSVVISAPQPMPWTGQSLRTFLSSLPIRSSARAIGEYLTYRAREALGSTRGFALVYWDIVNEQFDAFSELGLILLGVLPLFFATLSYHWINQEIQRVQIRTIKLERQFSLAVEAERQLRLETSFLSNPATIESRAVRELGMQPPTLEQVIFWEEIP